MVANILMQKGLLFSSDMLSKKIFPAHGFGSLKESGRSCFTQREHIFTTDIRYFGVLCFSFQNADVYVAFQCLIVVENGRL